MGNRKIDRSQLSNEEYKEEEKKNYSDSGYGPDGNVISHEVVMTTKEKENFELFLLSHPQIK